MKIKKEALLWTLYGGALILLFLLSSTNLIIKEREHEVYPISVIIEDAKDDYYSNFKKGMDRAAIEQNADVSFITLYESGSIEQQKDFIVREQQDGAKALVIAPIETRVISDMLAENRLNGPLVVYKTGLREEKINVAITPDYFAMGQQLGAQIVKNQKPDIPVYLFGKDTLSEVSSLVYDGVSSVLEDNDFLLVLLQKQDNDFFHSTIETLVYPGCKNVVIVALDPESLTETADILAGSTVYASYVDGLYGWGNTIPILNHLDQGVIKGICVTDEFGAGYSCVKKAVESIKNRGTQETVTLESYYIEKDDIRKPEYEKMLYPIE